MRGSEPPGLKPSPAAPAMASGFAPAHRGMGGAPRGRWENGRNNPGHGAPNYPDPFCRRRPSRFRERAWSVHPVRAPAASATDQPVHWQLCLPCCAGVVNAGACCNFASAFLSTGCGGMNPRQHHGELRLGFCIRPFVSLYASLECQIPAQTQPRGGTGTLSPPAALRARLRR